MTTRTDYLQIKLETLGDGSVKATLGETSRGLKDVDKSARDASGGMGLLKNAVGAIGLAQVVTYAIQTTAEFQRLTAVVRTLEGSQAAANVKLKELQEIASRTPAQLQEIVTAYTTLKARGLDPGRESLLAYANVAAASGKSIQQFVEAVGDAATGELERLKEFGIVGRVQGEQIALTFQGTTTVIEKSAGAIEGYLQDIGRVQFAGAAEEQMKTLGGAISNLEDALAKLTVSLGEGGASGGFTKAVAGAAQLLDILNQITKSSNDANSTLGKLDFVINTGPLEVVAAAVSRLTQSNAAEVSNIDRIKAAYNDVAGAIGRVVQAGAARVASSDKLIEKLRAENDVLGLSKAQLLERAKAAALDAAATEDQRETIAALFDAQIAAAKASEVRTKATKESTKASDDNAKADARHEAALRDIADAYSDLMEKLDPALRLSRELADAERVLGDAYLAGVITLQQYAAAYEKLQRTFAERSADGDDLAAVAEEQVNGYLQAWERGGEELTRSLRDALITGDWEDVGSNVAETILGGMLDTFLSENVTGPLQQAFSGIFQSALNRLSGGGGGGAGLSNSPTFSGSSSGGGGGGNSGNAGTGNGYNAGGVAGGALTGYAVGSTTAGGGGGAQAGGVVGGIIGSYFGPIGAVIGAYLGAAIGGLFDGDPLLRVRSEEFDGPRRSEGRATSRLGDIFVRTEKIESPTSAEIAARIAALDDALANLLTPEQIAAVRERLDSVNATYRDGAATLEQVITDRLNTIISVAAPQFSRFLASIADVEERLLQFEALVQLGDQVERLGRTIAEVSGSPLERLINEMARLDSAISQTASALSIAIASNDPAAIRDAAAAAEQAVLNRLRVEIELATQLDNALQSAAASARSLDLQLAQRIQSTGGRIGLVADAAQGSLAGLRGRVSSTVDPERALAFLNEFIATVDAWLSAAIGDVQTLANADAARVQEALAGVAAQRDAINSTLADLAAQRATISAALSELNAERNAILSAAQQRATEAAQQAQQAYEAQRAAAEALRQAQIEGLQAQLSIAQQFIAVLNQADALLRDLTFGSANPLGGFGRLELLNNAIRDAEATVAGSTGADQANAAQQLLTLLQQRLGLVQQEGLFQRPSPEFLQIYNDTLRRIAEVRDTAQPIADQALALQEQIAALQAQTNDAVRGLQAAVVQYSEAELSRLGEIDTAEAKFQLALLRIATREQALQEELVALAFLEAALQDKLVSIQQRADASIQALLATAREQYEWARGEQQRLSDLRQSQILEQLNALTGGLPVDQFIAERQAEAVDLLTSIRDDLREFLTSIETSTAPGGATLPPGVGGTPAPPEGPPRPHATGGLVINVVAPAGADAAEFGRRIASVIMQQVPQLATAIKRELPTA